MCFFLIISTAQSLQQPTILCLGLGAPRTATQPSGRWAAARRQTARQQRARAPTPPAQAAAARPAPPAPCAPRCTGPCALQQFWCAVPLSVQVNSNSPESQCRTHAQKRVLTCSQPKPMCKACSVQMRSQQYAVRGIKHACANLAQEL